MAAVLMLSATPALAQYKWKDASGQVHVSDLPPPRDVPDANILRRPAAPPRAASASAATPSGAASATAVTGAAATSGARPAGVDPEIAARRKRAEQEAQSKQKADDTQAAAQRADNCRRAQAQLQGLQSGQRMARFNDRGERVVMDDAMRNAEIATAQDAIAANCR